MSHPRSSRQSIYNASEQSVQPVLVHLPLSTQVIFTVSRHVEVANLSESVKILEKEHCLKQRTIKRNKIKRSK